MHKKILLTLLTVSILGLAGCGEEKPHEHTFRESWSYDNNHHWHEATCEHKDLTQDYGDHIDEDGDHYCDVCHFRHPNALAITKQPGIVYANYPESASMSIEVNDPSKIYYCQWQYQVGTDYEGKPRYKDVEGGAGYNTLTLEIPSIRQRAGDQLIFRCELGDEDGAVLFSEPGRFVVNNKTEEIDCAYFGDYAIKAGETLDLLDTPYGEGTISLNEEGNVYTFTKVNASYKYPMVSHGIFDNLFVIDSDTNTHEEITINLVGENILSNPYWDAAYNAGQDIIFAFFGSQAEQAKVIISGEGNLKLEGGSRLIACYSELEIDADIELKGFHYRLSNGISCDKDVVIKSGAHITGSVGGYGISVSGYGNLTIEDNAVVDLDIYPGKVMSGPTMIYGISAAYDLIIGKSIIDLDVFEDTNIYSVDGDGVSITGLLSHNSVIELNGADVSIDIKTSAEPLKDYFFVSMVKGIEAPFVGASGASVDINIDAKEADTVYGIRSQACQIINDSNVNIFSVGGVEAIGILSKTNEEKDGVKIHNSNVSVNMKYAPDIAEKAKICLFGIVTMLYDISLNESSTITLDCNGEGAAFGVVTITSSTTKVEPTPDYEPTALFEVGFMVQEAHSINVNSYKVSNYVGYETFVDTSSLAPLTKVTLVSSTK